MNELLHQLQQELPICSDCILSDKYRLLLKQLDSCDLTAEIVEYLCNIIVSKKYIWEIRFDHLRALLVNPTAINFDLKDFFLERIKRSRRLALKIFFIRGYALYADEEELIPVMKKFQANLKNNHDYIDYEFLLSAAGLPYLAKKYKYPCFIDTWRIAETEYQEIDPLLRGYFTIDKNLEQVNILSNEEINKRYRAFIEKLDHFN